MHAMFGQGPCSPTGTCGEDPSSDPSPRLGGGAELLSRPSLGGWVNDMCLNSCDYAGLRGF